MRFGGTLARIISASSSPWPSGEENLGENPAGDHDRSLINTSASISTFKNFFAALCSLYSENRIHHRTWNRWNPEKKKTCFLEDDFWHLGMRMDQKPDTLFFTPKWLHQNIWLCLVLIPSQLRGTSPNDHPNDAWSHLLITENHLNLHV